MVTVDLLKLFRQLPEDDEPFEVVVQPVVADGIISPLCAWTIRGTAKRLFKLEPELMTFGTVNRGDTIPPLPLAVSSRVPLKQLSADCGKDLITTKITRHDSHHWTVLVLPASNLQPGWTQVEVELRGQDEQGTVRRRPVVITGNILDDIETMPRGIALGALPIGTMATAKLVIRARRHGQLLAHARVNERAWPRMSAVLLDESNSHGSSFLLKTPIEKEGDVRGYVSFHAMLQDDQAPRHVTVEVSYYGLAK